MAPDVSKSDGVLAKARRCRRGCFLATVFTAVCLIRWNPAIEASVQKDLYTSVGRMTQKMP